MTEHEDIWVRKMKKLHREPEMEPLVEFVEYLREHSGGKKVPNFDPDDGGVDAEVLFILSDPGPTVKDTDFISRDNYLFNPRDRTAKNVIRASDYANLDRTRTISWNVIPWEVENDAELQTIEQEKARRERRLTELLDLFGDSEESNLRAVALFGGRARSFAGEVKEARYDLRIFEDYHPGWRYIDREDPMNHFKETFRQIKEFLD